MTGHRESRSDVLRRARSRAFTLVELLLVMFIMSVVASLVVGVSWYVIEQGRIAETSAKQKRLIQAINAYRKVKGDVPDLVYNPLSARTWERMPAEHMSRLLNELRTGSQTNQNIDRSNSYWKATGSFLGEDGGGSLTADAYGNSMIYQKDGGFGGGPRVVSAGPDGLFGFGDQGGKSATECQRDNIYSDK